MYKDIITYELADGINQEHLIQTAKQVASDWMSKLPGFINWEIHTDKEGKYSDIVCWESREDAMHAEREMANIPNGAEWFACYKTGTIASKNLTTIATL